jgi:hypothetical protein
MKHIVSILSIFIGIIFASSLAFAAEVEGKTKKGATIYSYNTPTNATEVSNTIRKIIVAKGRSVKIIVISSTHGARDGSVDKSYAEVKFKKEDLATANITSNLVAIRNYHETAPNRWQDISDSPSTVVIVLAWCYSNQWLSNTTANGNNGKIVMK